MHWSRHSSSPRPQCLASCWPLWNVSPLRAKAGRVSHLLVWIVPSPFNQHPLRIRVVPALVHLQPPRNQKEKGPACRRGVSSRMRCGMLSLGGRRTFCLSPKDASGYGTGGGNASKGESEAGGERTGRASGTPFPRALQCLSAPVPPFSAIFGFPEEPAHPLPRMCEC